MENFPLKRCFFLVFAAVPVVFGQTVVQSPAVETFPSVGAPKADFDRLVHGAVVYSNVKVVSVDPVRLGIVHDAGAAGVPLAELSPEIQARYSYDPQLAKEFLLTKQAAEEKARQSAKVPAAPTATPAGEALGVDENGDQLTAEQAATTERQSGPTSKADVSHSYEKLLCRNGRVYENVIVTKSHRNFVLSPQKAGRAKGEVLEFYDAPSKLLLDFEEFDELFRRMVVADKRTPLYELSSEGVEGGRAFLELAKNPRPGSSFVSVPEGYLLAHMNWFSLPMPAVELVIPVSGRAFAVANAGNLIAPKSISDWWNKNAGYKGANLPVPQHLAKTETSKNGVLYSPFNPDVPILGNTTGEMKQVWVESRKGNFGALALVETGNGLFFGYYREHAALEDSKYAWSDAIREKSGRFHLTKVNSRSIKLGERFLQLFDATARRILGAEFKEVGQLKLGGQHFLTLLQRGLEAAVQDRLLPKGDGVEFPESGVDSTSSPTLDKVVITDEVNVKLKDVLPNAYIFDVESKQRVIEIRKETVGGRITNHESRPVRRKQTEVVEVPPDLDGGLRLTDGECIYELRHFFGGTEMVV